MKKILGMYLILYCYVQCSILGFYSMSTNMPTRHDVHVLQSKTTLTSRQCYSFHANTTISQSVVTDCVPKIVINTIMESLIDGALPPGGKMKCCHAALLIFFSRKSLYCDSVRYAACCMFTCLTRELCISPCTYSPSFYFPCCQKICIYHSILRTVRHYAFILVSSALSENKHLSQYPPHCQKIYIYHRILRTVRKQVFILVSSALSDNIH